MQGCREFVAVAVAVVCCYCYSEGKDADVGTATPGIDETGEVDAPDSVAWADASSGRIRALSPRRGAGLGWLDASGRWLRRTSERSEVASGSTCRRSRDC